MGMTSRRTRCMTSFHAVIVVVVGLSTLVGVTGAERTLMQMQDNSEVSEWEDEEAALISGFENEFDEWEDEEAEVLSDLENEFDEMIDESVTYIEHLIMAEETLIAMESESVFNGYESNTENIYTAYHTDYPDINDFSVYNVFLKER